MEISTGRRTWVAAAALALAVARTATAADHAAEIDALLSRYHALHQLNGSVLVAEHGQVLLKRGYGLANMEWGIPNASDTRFRLGSITKQLTSMLVMQLVEEGKLSLDTTLAAALPGYRADTGAKVTIRHLLSHTSGIPSYTDAPTFRAEVSRNPYTVADFVKRFCSGAPEFAPGSAWKYSNSGYFLLGAVIERVAGKPYERVLKERILDPAGMASTGYDHSATILEKRAAGYQRTPDGFVNAPYLDMSIPFAAGALYSTVEDLYRWDQALSTDRLLSEAGRRTMLTPVMHDYAFGWGVRQAPIGPAGAPRTLVGHDGGINGFSTLIRRVPDDRILIVLLNNIDQAPLAALADGVLDILYGRTPPAPKRSLAEALAKTTGERGVEAAIAEYRDIKAHRAAEYALGENELNSLGYQLLGAGQTAAAVAVFRLNVEAFPQSSNVHDSLGEALAAAGQREDAVRSYARSLELDPANRNAVDWLQRLAGPPGG